MLLSGRDLGRRGVSTRPCHVWRSRDRFLEFEIEVAQAFSSVRWKSACMEICLVYKSVYGDQREVEKMPSQCREPLLPACSNREVTG
jgi:hypothetical protein